MVKSISPLSISNANLPIALRPAVDFPAVRGAIFDDPGDEKSWHASQRSGSLNRFYEGREPSWYASAIAPLRGANRVLDLGCGPGLALEALLDQGCTSVLGVDRWPAFAANSRPTAPIVAHDLTLPMPFLESKSFDGVLSHYALDYVSPIGMRQVLREAHRVLSPGGRLVIYVAAVGLGSGDAARTAVYSSESLRALLREAGFDAVDVVTSPNGRNSVAKARRSAGSSDRMSPREVQAFIDGDTQLSASFFGGSERLEFELVGPERTMLFALDLPLERASDDSRLSVCIRVQRSVAGGAELQLWVWRGYEPVAIDCARFELAATEMRVKCAGATEHVSVWRPDEFPLEPIGNAYVRFGDLASGEDLSEAERGGEGRQIAVESPQDQVSGAADWIGPGRNRFLIRQASRVDLSSIDQAWLAGQAHGVVLDVESLDGDRRRDLLLWAGWRQALIFINGSSWDHICVAISRRRAEMRSAVVLVDPALSGNESPQAVPLEMIKFVETHAQFFLLLGMGGKELSTRSDLARLPGRLLHGGPMNDEAEGMQEANEALRYLTERTVLMRLRQAHGYSPAEVGRRQAF